MRLVFVIPFLLLLLPCSYGQVNPTVLSGISEFISQDYKVLFLTLGDLNNDGIEDVILVLNKEGEDSLSTYENPLKRKLLLFLGQKDKTYKLAAQNENVVYYYGYDMNFKESFEDISIVKGTFSVSHYGGFAQRWGRTDVFAYDPSDKNWYLTRDEYSTFDVTSEDGATEETILSEKDFGRIPFEKFNVYEELKK